MTTETYKTAINFLKQKALSLDSMSEPVHNAVTQYTADQYKAQAVDVRVAIARLEQPEASHETLFMAACSDLGLISQTLGIDPDNGGAVPIMDAIAEMQSRLKLYEGAVIYPLEPKAWEISYKNPETGESKTIVFMHNAIDDYRMFDPDATSAPLCTHKPTSAMSHIGWYNTKKGLFFSLTELGYSYCNQELVDAGELVNVYAPQGQEAKDGN